MKTSTALDRLTTPYMHHPYMHRHVEVTGRRDNGELVSFSLVHPTFSEYRSGPSLFMLADAVAEIVGPGRYGCKGSELVGYVTVDADGTVRSFWDSDFTRRHEFTPFGPGAEVRPDGIKDRPTSPAKAHSSAVIDAELAAKGVR